MSNKHREGRIWYVTIADRRITCTGSVLTQGDKTMCSHTKIQYNNHSDILLRVQEEVCLRDSNSLRVKKMARVRVKGVRMTPRTRALREKEVSVKVDQARRQRRIGTTTTPNTHVRNMDMMNTPRGPGAGTRDG